jgi:transcriptional repressor NrdR
MREKLRQGMERACWKRPISDEQIEVAVSSIERAISDGLDDEIDSRTLGEMVMAHLGQMDQVAFVRFASVYREFKDVRDFVNELKHML